jgi:hypothetical protein
MKNKKMSDAAKRRWAVRKAAIGLSVDDRETLAKAKIHMEHIANLKKALTDAIKFIAALCCTYILALPLSILTSIGLWGCIWHPWLITLAWCVAVNFITAHSLLDRNFE